MRVKKHKGEKESERLSKVEAKEVGGKNSEEGNERGREECGGIGGVRD